MTTQDSRSARWNSPTMVGSAVLDDGLVERRQEHAEHQPGHDDQDLAVRERGLDLVRRLDAGGSSRLRSGTSRRGRRDRAGSDSVVTTVTRLRRRGDRSVDRSLVGDQPLEQLHQQGALGLRPAGHRRRREPAAAAGARPRAPRRPASVGVSSAARRSSGSLSRPTRPACQSALMWRLTVEGSSSSATERSDSRIGARLASLASTQ